MSKLKMKKDFFGLEMDIEGTVYQDAPNTFQFDLHSCEIEGKEFDPDNIWLRVKVGEVDHFVAMEDHIAEQAIEYFHQNGPEDPSE